MERPRVNTLGLFISDSSMWNVERKIRNFIPTKTQTMKRTIKSIGIILLLVVTANQIMAQTTISGVTLPTTMKAGTNNLLLNGGGVRVKLFMDMYVAGLYVTTKSNSGDVIAKANEPMAVKLHIVSGLVTTDRMKEAITEGFKKSTGGNTAPIQAKIDKFVNVFSQSPIVKGDVFDNVYVPGEGVKVYKNDKLIQTVDGLDFKTALWGIWLGNEPVDKGLKTGMLGVK